MLSDELNGRANGVQAPAAPPILNLVQPPRRAFVPRSHSVLPQQSARTVPPTAQIQWFGKWVNEIRAKPACSPVM